MGKIKYSEDTLISQLRRGDRTAFEYLYRNYSQALLKTIKKKIVDPGMAEEALHDTFIKVWQRFDRFDPEHGSLYTWMRQIAHHTAVDAQRMRRPVGIELAQLTLPDSMVYWPATDYIGFKYVIQQLLKPEQWQAVELAYWHGHTHEEIADRLGLPLGTVKTRIRLSIRQLRPHFLSRSAPFAAGYA